MVPENFLRRYREHCFWMALPSEVYGFRNRDFSENFTYVSTRSEWDWRASRTVSQANPLVPDCQSIRWTLCCNWQRWNGVNCDAKWISPTEHCNCPPGPVRRQPHRPVIGPLSRGRHAATERHPRHSVPVPPRTGRRDPLWLALLDCGDVGDERPVVRMRDWEEEAERVWPESRIVPGTRTLLPARMMMMLVLVDVDDWWAGQWTDGPGSHATFPLRMMMMDYHRKRMKMKTKRT